MLQADNFIIISCVDEPDIDVIREVFTKPFPFNNLGTVYISVQEGVSNKKSN